MRYYCQDSVQLVPSIDAILTILIKKVYYIVVQAVKIKSMTKLQKYSFRSLV